MSRPSKVISIKGVTKDMNESDLKQLLEPFGMVSRVVISGDKALLEMEDTRVSVKAMQYYSLVGANIRGKLMYVDFYFLSNLDVDQNFSTTAAKPPSSLESKANRILSVTVGHIIYPMDVDVLHEIFRVYGEVEKIIIPENSDDSDDVQAFIQYQTEMQAQNALKSLHGKNIYDGGCQLNIHVSKKSDIFVHYNDDKSRDFRNELLPTARLRPSEIGRDAIIALAFDGTLPPGVTGTNEHCTLIVHNMNLDKIDEDKVFNLFSNYGRIVRIEISGDEPVHALVEMADGLQAEVAAHYLKGVVLFGNKLEVNYSKNRAPSSNSKEYLNSKYNRFKNMKHCYKVCCAPSTMLHMSYLPEAISEEAVVNYMSEHGKICKVKLFGMGVKRNALVLFGTKEEATEALVLKSNKAFNGSVITIRFSMQDIY